MARYSRLPTSPVAAVVRPLQLSASTSSNSKRRTRRTKPDGYAVRALDPALKGEVCRATDQYRTAVPRPPGRPSHWCQP